MWQKCQIMCQSYKKLTFSQKQPGRFLSFWCHLIGTWGYLARLIAIYLVHFVPTLQTFQARCVGLQKSVRPRLRDLIAFQKFDFQLFTFWSSVLPEVTTLVYFVCKKWLFQR